MSIGIKHRGLDKLPEPKEDNPLLDGEVIIPQKDRMQYVIDRAKRANQPAEAVDESNKQSSKRDRKTKRNTSNDNSGVS